MIEYYKLNRRTFFSGALTGFVTLASNRQSWGKETTNLQQIISTQGLKNNTSAVLFDLETNQILESHNLSLRLPMASVTKALTAVYGLETIGRNYKFWTEVKSDGYLRKDGTLDGNIYIVGGGDPSLSINDLVTFVKHLKFLGIKRISGEFFYYDKWLPNFSYIDNTQLPEESFNPGLSGLNLNKNKVLFSWEKVGSNYNLKLEARGLNYNVLIDNITINDVNDTLKSYEYEINEKLGKEIWRVSKNILDRKGVRWLPVRLSAHYTSEVFRSLLKEHGLSVSMPRSIKRLPEKSNLLFRHESEPLNFLSEEMLYRSTNVVAEIVGLQVAKLWGLKTPSIKSSGEIMTNWFNYVTNTKGSFFANHSGLTVDTRVSAHDFTKFLTRLETIEILPSILKGKKIYGSNSNIIENSGIDVRAKTGTMHFNRALAGYIQKGGIPKAAFSIFSADVEKKKDIPGYELANPPGSKSWLKQAKNQENFIIKRWAEFYV